MTKNYYDINCYNYYNNCYYNYSYNCNVDIYNYLFTIIQ